MEYITLHEAWWEVLKSHDAVEDLFGDMEIRSQIIHYLYSQKGGVKEKNAVNPTPNDDNSTAEAEIFLHTLLMENKIRSLGTGTDGNIEDISDKYWSYCTPKWDENQLVSTDKPKFTNIKIALRDLRTELEKNARPRQTIRGEKGCRKWLLSQMKNSLDCPSTKTEIKIQAVQKFGVSKRAFDKLWDECVNKVGCNWSKPGRKRNHCT